MNGMEKSGCSCRPADGEVHIRVGPWQVRSLLWAEGPGRWRLRLEVRGPDSAGPAEGARIRLLAGQGQPVEEGTVQAGFVEFHDLHTRAYRTEIFSP